MAIELTTASKSTRVGILSAFYRSNVYGDPILDNTAVDGIVIYTDEAAEGTSVPDAAGASFTKTYNLNRTVSSGFLITQSFQHSMGGSTFGIVSKVASKCVAFPTLSSATFNINAERYAFLPGLGLSPGIFYVTTDYTQAKRFNAHGFWETDPNTGLLMKNTYAVGIGKTYSDQNNILTGYYGGPFGGEDSIICINEGGSAKRTLIESMYFSGTNLVIKLKKTQSTTGAVMNRDGILILPD